jgi:ERCC4-type nuclease
VNYGRRKSRLEPVIFPLLVLIDDREQLPYCFDGFRANSDRNHAEILVGTETRRLETGDYSLDGHTDKIVIERKSKSDLFSTLSQGGENHRRERFMAELERMASIPYAYVMVECQWSDIFFDPPILSQLTPKSICRTVISMQQKYPNIHWHFMPDREFAQAMTFRILERYMFNLPTPEATPDAETK